ncbi:DUF155-domain-containing protein [Dendrothele bispora CBS 962.96]|uniref:DUF155-domain-containing protein n=1 Tax=Dendrothele bispora (strain CBS 962.96) TaxID=1314807 RepID=A0A4S8LVN1_DENBC|nr:DUF155-domain-containing protein [Dendrothele bispora CBS 962.96]
MADSRVPRRPRKPRIASLNTINRPPAVRRASISGLTPSSAPKAQRTSKTSQKLVVLPSAPQTKPLHQDQEEDLTLGYETDAGVHVREYKSAAERMSKEQRKKAGFKRITAYCIAESFKMKVLAGFLKREHNVAPRVFDEALYVMYHLPLLPGYGPNANVRSSAPVQSEDGRSFFARLSEAEEMGYQGSYFHHDANQQHARREDGYITSSPVERRSVPDSALLSESAPLVSDSDAYTGASDAEADADVTSPMSDSEQRPGGNPFVMPISIISPSTESHLTSLPSTTPPSSALHMTPLRDQEREQEEQEAVETIFFDYGVVVFFGFTEVQEKSILEDIENAGVLRRKIPENDWEIEECHFTLDKNIKAPRIYNDFFTLKSHSHLLKLSISHALAQSTLLAHFETSVQAVLSSPSTLSIPTQLARSGALQLKRREALKLTGKLFKLRRDVNLVSNVLDVPELFWDEASLKELYDAVREYMEIGGRVQVLNEKLDMASDFLEAIHEHLNNSAMERITWIVIWLIVVAILVELGEVVARLIVHATMGSTESVSVSVLESAIPLRSTFERENVLRVLDEMASRGSA